jgi:hypothetical protein
LPTKYWNAYASYLLTLIGYIAFINLPVHAIQKANYRIYLHKQLMFMPCTVSQSASSFLLFSLKKVVFFKEITGLFLSHSDCTRSFPLAIRRFLRKCEFLTNGVFPKMAAILPREYYGDKNKAFGEHSYQISLNCPCCRVL